MNGMNGMLFVMPKLIDGMQIAKDKNHYHKSASQASFSVQNCILSSSSYSSS